MFLAALTLILPFRAGAQTPNTSSLPDGRALTLAELQKRAGEDNPQLAENAALKYWQAFALLPTLDKGQQKVLEQWQKAPFDAVALKLIDRSSKSRLYLQRAAKLPRCDWSLDYQDGIDLLLPHLGKARTLASLTALHARHEFEHGHWKTGAEDLTALLSLARHLEVDPPLIIQYLVGGAIETVAIQTAAPYLPELKSLLAQPASAALKGLGTGASLQQMVLKEKQIGAVWFIRELKKAEEQRQGSWQELWRHVFVPAEGHREDADLVKSAKTFEQAVKMLEELLPWYDRLAKVSALPWKEFDATYPDFIKQAKAANPLSGYVLPNIGRLVPTERRIQTQRALFKAALAIVQGGPEKLKGSQDPYGDGPFEYRALDKGFELRSRLVVRGQPLTLTVGTGKKE
jgi:hypothetical protein